MTAYHEILWDFMVLAYEQYYHVDCEEQRAEWSNTLLWATREYNRLHGGTK